MITVYKIGSKARVQKNSITKHSNEYRKPPLYKNIRGNGEFSLTYSRYVIGSRKGFSKKSCAPFFEFTPKSIQYGSIWYKEGKL